MPPMEVSKPLVAVSYSPLLAFLLLTNLSHTEKRTPLPLDSSRYRLAYYFDLKAPDSRVLSFSLQIRAGFTQVLTRFLKLETLPDENVDQKIELQIERSGTSMTVDLEAIQFAFQKLDVGCYVLEAKAVCSPHRLK